MLRVTRNCPWNKCRFCSLYKGTQFSIRKRADVIADIDAVASYVNKIAGAGQLTGSARAAAISSLNDEIATDENRMAAESAMHFYRGGLTSVFLQDANSLLTKTDDLLAILTHLREKFPSVERITTYARSKTVIAKGADDLARLMAAGLDRIHIGMESGADNVLAFMDKGAKKADHVRAGQLVRGAGIELSEYFILGLGGLEMSRDNALETADALNRIDPDFIRVRTLTVPGRLPLAEDVRSGVFTPLNDVQGAEELLLMLKNLDVHSYLINNDHILNLLPEASGKLPEEKSRMIGVIEWFLGLPEKEQMIYRIGRRAARINSRADMENPQLTAWAADLIDQEGINRDNIDTLISKTMRRFI
jgi:biotin synthase-like enzyme